MLPEISYLTAIATACATASFMLATMHLVMWHLTGRRAVYLLGAVMVTSAGCQALFELHLLSLPDVANYVHYSRLMHVSLLVMMVSMVMFVRSYLNAGPRWLIIAIAVCWGASVVQSMVLPYSAVHSEITELVQARTAWGETIWIASGPVNPGKYIADLGVLLTLVFLVLSIITATRRGNGGDALLVGGSAALFLLSAGFIAIIQDLGVVTLPFFIPITFLAIVGALSYKFVEDAFRAREAALEVAQLRRVITLGEMVGGITHEINQPLSAIQSNAQAGRRFLAADATDVAEIREIFDDIVADSKRASEIIHGVRRMLQRESTTGATAEPDKVILAASDLVKGELHAREVSLRVNSRPTGNRVRADSMELTQVLVNLLLNAIRAASESDKQGRTVTINYREDNDAGFFSVEDRGPGISDELIDRLFEPFVSKSEDGLGVGLSVCRRIVERANGNIWAQQRKGGGAVFQVKLPLANESGEA